MHFNDGQHCWHHMHFKLFIGVFYCSEVVQVITKFQINICVKHTINQYQRGVGCYHSIFNMAQSFEEARWPLARWAPGRGHCVAFLDKTLNCHNASLHPGVYMGTSELLGKVNKLRGSDL